MEVMAKHKRAAAYCRVSTDLEMQEGSFEWQKGFFVFQAPIRIRRQLCGIAADLYRNPLDSGCHALTASYGHEKTIRSRTGIKKLSRSA